MDEEEKLKRIKKYDLYYDFFVKVENFVFQRKGMRLSCMQIYTIMEKWDQSIRVGLVYNNNYKHCANHIYNSWYQTYMKNELFSFEKKRYYE